MNARYADIGAFAYRRQCPQVGHERSTGALYTAGKAGDRYSFLVMHDYDCRIASCASKGKAKAQLSLRHQAFNVTKPEMPALITSI